MASSSSSHQQNQRFNAFSEIESASKRRMVSESSRVYDVFINHRGPDVKGTLATQLYKSLQQLGIDAFLDSEEKELGNSFPSIIETAIRSAKVHIAIFSIRYAESAWCLNELVLMLESTAKIIPIFYQVKPSDLRYIETGVYAEAFIKYEEKGRYLEKLNAWKEALRSLSFTAGEEFNSFSDGDCQKIVAAVQKEVQRKTCLHVADYPVGLTNLVEDFEKRCLDELVQDFESQCRQEVGKHKPQVVGIFGMGGVGKTTLAKELFNRKGLYYKRSSFLFDVREKSVTSQLPSLQSKLVKDLFGKEITFTSTEEGTACLKGHLQRSHLLSVLVVVDDIDQVQQLTALAVIDILKASDNSLVIVTTRDAGVLITSGIHVGYNLKGMDRNYAKELFCWHAFHKAHPCSEYEELVEDFVDVCGGLPLSLQVLGRHVHGRPRWYWSSELIKISKTLPRDVKQRLVISFEALDNEEKQVFMDAACFFVGKPKSIAERVWEASGWNAQHALETLKDKCLIVEETENLSLNVEGRLVLRMHDHLRDLGREMAFELKPPQRLWRPQDLKSLELGGFKNILTKTNVRCFSSIFDESMGCRVTFFLGQSDSWLETSASLLWLQLDGYSEEQPSIPSWIPLQNLHCLKIWRLGQLKTLWENRIQAPSQLRELRIFYTSLNQLEEYPDLSRMSSLKVIEICECEKIQNIRLPTAVVNLSLQGCRDLRTVAGTGDLLELGKLTLRECPELEELPDLSRMSCLRKIMTGSCEKLQNIEGIEELQALTCMKLVYCTNALIRNSVHKLKSLPDRMCTIGRATDGAELSLNENMFQDANIDVDGVGEIGPHTIFAMRSEFVAVFVCFVVAVDSCTWVRDINESIKTASFNYWGDEVTLEVREGEWVVTLVGCPGELCNIDEILDVLRRHGIVKKGIWVGLRKDKMGKGVQVLSTIVDRLYHL